ncbi:MAG: PSD1 and planctomycete cytochrome C domain-containing protein [Pirellulales bacterium]
MRLLGVRAEYDAIRCCIVVCVLLFVTFPSVVASAGERVPSYTREIRGLLSNRCVRCHGPDKNERQGGGDGGLRLDTADGATADLGGYAAIVPGRPEQSELIARIESLDTDVVMPPPEAGQPLSREEKDLLRRWIAAGARYEPHWSYVPPRRPVLPSVRNRAWTRNEIDYFILSKLEAEDLSPQPEASRFILARRLSLDLTGLPATVESVDAFVANRSPNAVQEFTDSLFDHDGYGEHMARQWLDIARYADSAGYADDPPREIWGWRDWVVRAFDNNMPFDDFTIKQLAGDLLPNATVDDKVATAFHRNTLTNNEGGTIDEEFRSVAVVDRVNTTMSTWMGTTMACAQCHDHKYDPLSQEEYFQLYAILNNTADADRRNEAPTIRIPWKSVDEKRAVIEKEIAELQKGIPELRKKVPKGFSEPPEFQPARKILEQLQKKLSQVPVITVPVMEELPVDKQRVTHIQIRGNWKNLGKEVSAGVPEIFHGIPSGDGETLDRLVLAKWLVDPANPLTARVVVNRLWEHFFGIGLVSTSEEFGSQGEVPSHPELLDWLACELIDNAWDLQSIQRLIVTSAAYQQSSKCPPEVLEKDPENKLISCGPRIRLSAEVIRDQALAAAGLLSRKKGGPSVNPPQPDLGLKAAFGGGIDWKTSTGEDRYRRAIYTTWRRSNPYPSMATFDAPSREVCTVRRPRTNTPLQALVTMNDPVYIEAAQGLARRIVHEGGASLEDRATLGFRLVLSRYPTSMEIKRLVHLFEEAQHHYLGHAAAAKDMATNPLGPLSQSQEVTMADLAAWTVVSNIILNLDEAFMCP